MCSCLTYLISIVRTNEPSKLLSSEPNRESVGGQVSMLSEHCGRINQLLYYSKSCSFIPLYIYCCIRHVHVHVTIVLYPICSFYCDCDQPLLTATIFLVSYPHNSHRHKTKTFWWYPKWNIVKANGWPSFWARFTCTKEC